MHFEPLENRRLLTATVEGRILTVLGTLAADNVRFERTEDGAFDVIINGSNEGSFNEADVDRVTARLLGGGDGLSFVDAPGRPTKAGNPVAAALETPIRVFGGIGNDTVTTSGGNDTIKGGKGDDQLNGATGNDRIFGQSGIDDLDGSDGNDRLDGGTNGDFLDGGSGNDKLYGNKGADTLDLNLPAGADTLHGHQGPDTIYTDDDNDVIFGGAGKDDVIEV